MMLTKKTTTTTTLTRLSPLPYAPLLPSPTFPLPLPSPPSLLSVEDPRVASEALSPSEALCAPLLALLKITDKRTEIPAKKDKG